MLVARGSLLPASYVKVEAFENQLQFHWGATLQENARSNDQVMAVAYNSVKEETVYDYCLAKRINSFATLLLPSTWLDDIIHPYLAFRSADGNIVSDSVYGV